MAVECFLIQPVGVVRWGLRRYSKSEQPSPCPTAPGQWGYHNATAILGEEPEVTDERGYTLNASRGVPPADDPRWPDRCACSYLFKPGDEWQKWVEALYQRADTGERFTLREAPPGAMWNAFWMGQAGLDGLSLCVKLPSGHEWWIDGPATNGPGWTRIGEAPRITANPSISAPGYHGWLQNGVLSDPI